MDIGTRRHYCFFGSKYDPDSPVGRKRVALLAELVREYLEPEGGVVLDVGCGMGVSAEALARAGFERVVGIDIVEEYVQKAREYAAARGLEAEFHLMDIREPSLEPESFDAIAMLSNPLPHWSLSDMERILAHCYKLLKPGGDLMIHYLDWVAFLHEGYKDVMVEETGSGHLVSYHAELNTLEGYVKRLFVGPAAPRGFTVRFRLWSPWILHHFLEKAGFTNIETEYPSAQRIAITTAEKPL